MKRINKRGVFVERPVRQFGEAEKKFRKLEFVCKHWTEHMSQFPKRYASCQQVHRGQVICLE